VVGTVGKVGVGSMQWVWGHLQQCELCTVHLQPGWAVGVTWIRMRAVRDMVTIIFLILGTAVELPY